MTMDLKENVRAKYGEAALRVKTNRGSCCGAAPGSPGCADPITSNLYDASETAELPKDAVKASPGLRQSHSARAFESR